MKSPWKGAWALGFGYHNVSIRAQDERQLAVVACGANLDRRTPVNDIDHSGTQEVPYDSR